MVSITWDWSLCHCFLAEPGRSPSAMTYVASPFWPTCDSLGHLREGGVGRTGGGVGRMGEDARGGWSEPNDWLRSETDAWLPELGWLEAV